MSSINEKACFEDVTRRLRAAKGKRLLVQSAEGTAWLCISGMLLFGFGLGLDAFFDLSTAARLAVAAGALVCLAAVAIALALLPVARTIRWTRHRIARFIEERFPSLQSHIVTVLDFYPKLEHAETPSRGGFLSLAISAAHRQTTSANFTEAVSARRAARLWAFGAAALAVACIGVMLNPSGFMVALGRYTGLFREYREARAEASLHVEVVESETVHVLKGSQGTEVAAIHGSDVEVKIVGDSNRPVTLRLYARRPGEERFNVTEVGTAETEEVTLHGVSEDTEFHLRLGPAQSETSKVRVTDYPKIRNVQLRLRFPDYTRVRPEFVPSSDGQIRALFGTEVEAAIEADKPLVRGTFTIYGKRVSVKGHGQRITARFLVTANGSYSVEVGDADGFANQAAFERSIESLPDQPPAIEADAPDEMTLGKAEVKSVAARLRAQDDYGIEKIRLVYQVGVLPGVRLSQERSGEPRMLERKVEPRRMVNVVFPCRFEDLRLEVGEVVTYHFEVEDTDTESGPHVAKSKTLRLVVVGTELRDWIELEDEDRWPTDFAGFTGALRATGLAKPGANELVKDAGEKPNERSAGVTNAAEGFLPHQLRESYSDYVDSLNEVRK